MASVNRVTVLGNLTKDPETRYMPDGGAVTNATIATNRQWKDKATGDRKEEVEFHRVVFYGRQAEVAGEFTRKGKPVYVEGRLRTRKWQSSDGQDRYTTEIIAEELQLLGSREDGQSGGQERRETQREPARAAPTKRASFEDMDDAIPF